ncbi:hypothetical protein JCM16163A_49240 [Paenibacillus sp. YK5]|nr:hypothetical protein PN4B1_42210 [Paenibacillus naphthalenovorans]
MMFFECSRKNRVRMKTILKRYINNRILTFFKSNPASVNLRFLTYSEMVTPETKTNILWNKATGADTIFVISS